MSQVSLNGPPYGVDTIVVQAAGVNAVTVDTNLQSVQMTAPDAAGATVTLPDAAASNAGQSVIVSNKAAAGNAVTVGTVGAPQNIIGVTSAVTQTLVQNRTSMYVSDGTHWYVVYYAAIATP